MDYNAKSLSVDETILYPNHTGQTLNDLVLAVEPNYWQNCFTLKSLADKRCGIDELYAR